ncbi:hypothetical protein FRC16_011083 [Serendipita sp. 398]|nr:hypothetical protein FRC16_011083 [Serendipita sp. 398]
MEPATFTEDSPEFPPVQGGFALISSDGIRFHINSSILAHSSRFFNDLFSLPSSEQSTTRGRDQTTLSMTQNSETLRQLLTFIDPNKPRPRAIQAHTIVNLIEAACLYRVPAVVHWFQDTYDVAWSVGREKVTERSFISEHPLLSLALCFRLGFKRGVEQSILELVECNVDKWDEDVEINGRLFNYCRKLRQERTMFYQGMVEKLSGHEYSNSHQIKDTNKEICMSCAVSRAQWTYDLMQLATEEPKWSLISGKVESTEWCSICGLSWIQDLSNACASSLVR